MKKLVLLAAMGLSSVASAEHPSNDWEKSLNVGSATFLSNGDVDSSTGVFVEAKTQNDKYFTSLIYMGEGDIEQGSLVKNPLGKSDNLSATGVWGGIHRDIFWGMDANAGVGVNYVDYGFGEEWAAGVKVGLDKNLGKSWNVGSHIMYIPMRDTDDLQVIGVHVGYRF